MTFNYISYTPYDGLLIFSMHTVRSGVTIKMMEIRISNKLVDIGDTTLNIYTVIYYRAWEARWLSW